MYKITHSPKNVKEREERQLNIKLNVSDENNEMRKCEERYYLRLIGFFI